MTSQDLLQTGLSVRHVVHIHGRERCATTRLESSLLFVDLFPQPGLDFWMPSELIKSPTEGCTGCLVPRKQQCPDSGESAEETGRCELIGHLI